MVGSRVLEGARFLSSLNYLSQLLNLLNLRNSVLGKPWNLSMFGTKECLLQNFTFRET